MSSELVNTNAPNIYSKLGKNPSNSSGAVVGSLEMQIGVTEVT